MEELDYKQFRYFTVMEEVSMRIEEFMATKPNTWNMSEAESTLRSIFEWTRALPILIQATPMKTLVKIEWFYDHIHIQNRIEATLGVAKKVAFENIVIDLEKKRKRLIMLEAKDCLLYTSPSPRDS